MKTFYLTFLDIEKGVNRTQRNIKNDLESTSLGQNTSSASDHVPGPKIVSIHLTEIGKYISYGGLKRFHFVAFSFKWQTCNDLP